MAARREPINGGVAGTGMIDGTFCQSLEETGINFATEADMIRQAHELDLLMQSARLIDEWAEAVRNVHKDVMVIAHGGPVSMPEDVAFILEHSTHCGGFYGAKGRPRAAQP